MGIREAILAQVAVDLLVPSAGGYRSSLELMQQKRCYMKLAKSNVASYHRLKNAQYIIIYACKNKCASRYAKRQYT